MSNEAQGLVRNLAMDAPAKPILMAYANYVDESGYTWAGVDCIAFDTGYSVDTVKRVRRELIAKNILRTKRRFGTSSGTRINLQKVLMSGVDRGDRTRIKPEFEFEDETPGQDQRGLTAPNGGSQPPRSGLSALNVGAVSPVVGGCEPPGSGLTAPLSLSYSLEDPSIGETQDSKTPSWVENLVIDLDYGRHRRPTQKQARELMALCHAANRDHRLTRNEIRAHCVRALKDATKSGVSYLLGALQTDRLPIHDPNKRVKSSQKNSAVKEAPSKNVDLPDFYVTAGFDPKFIPKARKEEAR